MSIKSEILFQLRKMTSASVKELSKKLELHNDERREFKKALQKLIDEGRIARNDDTLTLANADPIGLKGTFKKLHSGHGIVTTLKKNGEGVEWFIREDETGGAITGDTVIIAPVKGSRDRQALSDRAKVLKIAEHGRTTFVGSYAVKKDKPLVRVDDDVFERSLKVVEEGPPVAEGDRVWVEVIDFPKAEERGTCRILERLGEAGNISVEEKALLKTLGIPEEFPQAALDEAKRIADEFQEVIHPGREDFTKDLVITIDPIDAKDHDDAISLVIDPKTGHRILTVHIADLAYFVSPGGALDNEARKRGTSVYLPVRAIPMFPELLSNHVASLKEGVLRYVKTVVMEFNAEGARVHTRFANGAIHVRKRFHYEEVQAFLDGYEADWSDELKNTLTEMHAFSRVLRKRRFARGSLEMHLPQTKLRYNAEGVITGAYFTEQLHSHQLIEEFMLAANEAVAGFFRDLDVPFLRRVHPTPEEHKLEQFAEFARSLGFPMKRATDRYELQRVLDESDKTESRQAVHFALLRSLKQAVYSPMEEGHYALAARDYCHFTSPIRRYPDLTVHRLLNQWIKKKKIAFQEEHLQVLGAACSKRERVAEEAERQAVQLRLMEYIRGNMGLEFDAVITGVIERGFFAQGNTVPVEGFVSLEDFPTTRFHHDSQLHSLTGRGSRLAFKLGDKVRVKVKEIDKRRVRLKWVKAKEDRG